MKEQYAGTEGRVIKNGDRIEMTFYSYIEPLSSVVGTFKNSYLYVEDGCIPLEKSQIYCTEVRIIEKGKHEN